LGLEDILNQPNKLSQKKPKNAKLKKTSLKPKPVKKKKKAAEKMNKEDEKQQVPSPDIIDKINSSGVFDNESYSNNNFSEQLKQSLTDTVNNDKTMDQLGKNLWTFLIDKANFESTTADQFSKLLGDNKEKVEGLSLEASKSFSPEQRAFVMAAVKRTDLPRDIELGSRMGFDGHEAVIDNLQGDSTDNYFKGAKQTADDFIALKKKFPDINIVYEDKKDLEAKKKQEQQNRTNKKLR
jgi:hypothetical protein